MKLPPGCGREGINKHRRRGYARVKAEKLIHEEMEDGEPHEHGEGSDERKENHQDMGEDSLIS